MQSIRGGLLAGRIKAFASEALPTLESHVQMAEQTHAALTGKTAAGTSGMKK